MICRQFFVVCEQSILKSRYTTHVYMYMYKYSCSIVIPLAALCSRWQQRGRRMMAIGGGLRCRCHDCTRMATLQLALVTNYESCRCRFTMLCRDLLVFFFCIDHDDGFKKILMVPCRCNRILFIRVCCMVKVCNTKHCDRAKIYC